MAFFQIFGLYGIHKKDIKYEYSRAIAKRVLTLLKFLGETAVYVSPLNVRPLHMNLLTPLEMYHLYK